MRVLLDAMREAVQQDRARRRAPFDDELTPTITAAEALHPSQRPTRPPPAAPPPLGSFAERQRTRTVPSMPPPPPKRRG